MTPKMLSPWLQSKYFSNYRTSVNSLQGKKAPKDDIKITEACKLLFLYTEITFQVVSYFSVLHCSLNAIQPRLSWLPASLTSRKKLWTFMHLNGTQERTVRALIEQELKRKKKSIGCFFKLSGGDFFPLFPQRWFSSRNVVKVNCSCFTGRSQVLAFSPDCVTSGHTMRNTCLLSALTTD